MATRLIIFEGESILKLLTHYSHVAEDITPIGGRVPLDAELLAIGFNKFLTRWVQLQVRSGQWDEKPDPITGRMPVLHIRYEGQRVMRWGDPHAEAKNGWTDERMEGTCL